MKLVTWNIQWGRGADGRVDLDRIVAHARRFADFDVLCLQEVSDGYPELPGCDGSDQFRALAERLPGYEAVAGVGVDAPSPVGGRRRFGNMLFSRLPVRQVFRHLLPWPAEAGVKSMQRIALEATLETPIGPLRVTTTHLEYYSVPQRLAQVERLRELHREAVGQARCERRGSAADGPFDPVPRGAAAVLTGDCNFDPASTERAKLMAPIDDTPAYRDAWSLVHSGRGHEPTVGLYDKVQWPTPSTFDFFFVSDDLSPHVRDVRVDASSDASDHQPVLLELSS
ncbi:endonuclease/exonuclease/phosphatase family protein [Piscinibacter sp.]|uniref:endonuclease/exonuclease/phosphatase family protein n=1 Tax=Piscinibacter sp. TaxID=1903157 RepID=UPI002B90DD8D|nr:endonuclease/exonuclease/phosphatase family protein [Albitalea sp.]HUG24720.1 endonuclease/exonuclease/phosphatase family protein [Albitalea sp.]